MVGPTLDQTSKASFANDMAPWNAFRIDLTTTRGCRLAAGIAGQLEKLALDNDGWVGGGVGMGMSAA